MKTKKMKGLTIIFEQVMLFAVSVSIFLALFSVFSIYQNFFVSVSNLNQLDEAEEWVSSHILNAAESTATVTIIIPVPRHIGGSVYDIELTQQGLHLRTIPSNTTRISTLYGINESYSLSGKTTSIKGKLTIKKQGGVISII